MSATTQLKEGDKVFVYFNLKKKLFSVRKVSTGLVVAHLLKVSLNDARFKVSQKGRERVLRERVKNVHAGVEGFFTFDNKNSLTHNATYNPYKYSSFVDSKTLDSVDYASVVMLEKTPERANISYSK